LYYVAIKAYIYSLIQNQFYLLDGLWCLTPLSTIFHLYRGGYLLYTWLVILFSREYSWKSSKLTLNNNQSVRIISSNKTDKTHFFLGISNVESL